jgi:hypothetical protein
MLNGDDVTDADSPPLAQKWLTNPSINGLTALGLNGGTVKVVDMLTQSFR